LFSSCFSVFSKKKQMKKYSRKAFLKKSSLAALAGGTMLTGCVQTDTKSAEGSAPRNDKKYTWTMVTTWPPKFPVVGEGAELFAQWVEAMSGGRLKIKVYGGGELVPPLEVFDAVSSGTADMGSGAAYYWAGKSPATQFFASVPFGMNAQQVNAWIYSGGGQALWDEVYAPFNLMGMLGGNTGVQMGGWFNREINSIADFKGLKMRIPGLGGKVLEKVGGTPVNLPGSEIYTSLETGVIDATEWIGPYHDYKMGFADISKYYYSPGWHEPGTALELLFNRDAFNELPADLQEIVRTAAARLNVWTLSEFEAQNNGYLQRLKNEKNIQLRSFSSEILAELRKATREVLEEITASDPLSKKVYQAYSKFQQEVNEWSSLTEKVFYSDLSGG
jgi:TRAP-type mannitol/chloroaromatic compound transport system substrate-binding protein